MIVSETCPNCDWEEEYDVEENVWAVRCKKCGKPMLLCDKCYTAHGFDGSGCTQLGGNCQYLGELRELEAMI